MEASDSKVLLAPQARGPSARLLFLTFPKRSPACRCDGLMAALTFPPRPHPPPCCSMTPLQPELHELSDPTRTDYGNTLREMRKPLQAAAVVGLILVALGTLSMASEEKLTLPRFLLLLLSLPAAPALILLLVSPSFASRIEIRDGQVRHLLFGRKLLKALPLEDYLRVKMHEHGCAAVIHFTEGRRIHIFAMSLLEIARMTADLDSLHTQIAFAHAG